MACFVNTIGEVGHLDGVPFLTYNNQNWSETPPPNYTYYQYHRRGSGNQLSTIIEEGEKKFKEYIEHYSIWAGVDLENNAQVQVALEEFKKILQSFKNEFDKNIKIVDTKKDEEEEYVYSSGDTTLTFSLEASANYESTTFFKNNTKVRKMSIDGGSTAQAFFTFKFSNINIKSTKQEA